MSETTEHYFVVRVKLKEVKAFNGSILTKAGTIGWLATSDGYWSIIRGQNEPYDAQRFKTPPTQATIAKYDGMPWYNRIDTAEVISVEAYKKVIETRNEKIVAKY